MLSSGPRDPRDLTRQHVFTVFGVPKPWITYRPKLINWLKTTNFPQCGFSGRAIQVLKASGVDVKGLKTINVLEEPEIRQGIKEYSNWPTIPQLYVKGEFIGGSDIMMEMFESGELTQVLKA